MKCRICGKENMFGNIKDVEGNEGIIIPIRFNPDTGKPEMPDICFECYMKERKEIMIEMERAFNECSTFFKGRKIDYNFIQSKMKKAKKDLIKNGEVVNRCYIQNNDGIYQVPFVFDDKDEKEVAYKIIRHNCDRLNGTKIMFLSEAWGHETNNDRTIKKYRSKELINIFTEERNKYTIQMYEFKRNGRNITFEKPYIQTITSDDKEIWESTNKCNMSGFIN